MDNFVNRLEFLLQHYEFTASTFADKIGVQRSSLSHLLSGRNKPSLDFIMKIYEAFPELNLYWLLKGEGDFSAENSPVIQTGSPSLFSEVLPIAAPEPSTDLSKQAVEKAVEAGVDSVVEKETATASTAPLVEEKFEDTPQALAIKKIRPIKEIEQIVIFYTDGTFSPYTPN
ncbi:helix-turn-helix transcriptional regulator [Flavobacterium sp. JP2137]|uniref:helix-turn-helix transcriptional regulator n=1 Tax=Flavobacterium sp. JP2137 TaxID=3414510 RepID=UPI003D2FB1E8